MILSRVWERSSCVFIGGFDVWSDALLARLIMRNTVGRSRTFSAASQ